MLLFTVKKGPILGAMSKIKNLPEAVKFTIYFNVLTIIVLKEATEQLSNDWCYSVLQNTIHPKRPWLLSQNLGAKLFCRLFENNDRENIEIDGEFDSFFVMD